MTVIASDKQKTITYSEIFRSIQGEGKYTGITSVWLRFHLCNLQCDGFGQKDPSNPASYDLPYKDFDVSSVEKVEDLPVWKTGCDSSYTWAKKFRHLMHKETVVEVCDKISALIPHEYFSVPDTDAYTEQTHMCFTGGEPMMHQDAMVDILEELQQRNNLPSYVTVETNGTQKLTPRLRLFLINNYKFNKDREWFWSVSPKLYYVSGERARRAIQPELVSEYLYASPAGQLKPVLTTAMEAWDEWIGIHSLYRQQGIMWPVYVMAVGATEEDQTEVAAEVCKLAMECGFNFSGRLHAHIFGNQIGT